jgi:hypothetical protein
MFMTHNITTPTTKQNKTMSRRRHSDASDSSYTEHTARYTDRESRGGGGHDRADRTDRTDRAGKRDNGATLKSIDPNEEKHLQDIIKTAGESEFLNFVLYIKDGDKNSYAALDLLNGNVMLKQQTFIQEISLLRVRPTWLNGVPIIVDKAEGVAHRGTKCHDFLRMFQQREAMGQLGRRINKGRRMQFDTAQAFSFQQTLTSSPWDVKGTPADLATGRVPRVSAKDDTGKITERDGQAYEQKRAALEVSIRGWQHKG